MLFLGPVWIAAVVLGAAGVGKLWRPAAAAAALASLRLPHRAAAVRLLGAAEVAVAAAVIVVGGAVPALVLAATYLALALAAHRLRAIGDVAGCGCFGRSAAPVGVGHVVLNAAAAVVAVAAALDGVAPLGQAWSQLPAYGAAHAVLVATGAAAAVAMLTVLPETRLAAKPAPAPDPRIHLFGPTIGRKPGGGTGEGPT